jgi:hypothetical protein
LLHRFGGGLGGSFAAGGVELGAVSRIIRSSSSSLNPLRSGGTIGSEALMGSLSFTSFIASATSRSTATLGTRLSPANDTVGRIPSLISW